MCFGLRYFDPNNIINDKQIRIKKKRALSLSRVYAFTTHAFGCHALDLTLLCVKFVL